MIIELSASTNELESIADRRRLNDVITDLIQADRNGCHLIIFSRMICEWCASKLDFSERDRSVLLRIKGRYTEVGSLKAEAKVFVSLRVNDQAPVCHDNKAIEVGILNEKVECLFRQVCFVVEDQFSDGEFYKVLFEALRWKWRYQNIEYELRHGGGQRIVEIVEAEIRQKRVVVAVVDSERRTPDEKPARNAEKVCEILRVAVLGRGFPTLGVEMENYIPFSFIQELSNVPTCGRKDLLNALFENAGETWRHFDVKKGVALADMRNQERRMWWRNRIESACLERGLMIADEVSGLGDIIERFLDNNETQSKFFRHMRTCFLGEDEEEHFRSIVSFFIASKKWATI